MANVTLPQVGLTGTNTISGSESVQADTIVKRDGSSDIYVNGLRAATSVRTAGSLYVDWVAKSANFTIDESSHIGTVYGVSTASGAVTVTLPAAASNPDKVVTIIKTNSEANAIVMDPNGSETIGGTTSYAIYRQYAKLMIISNGTNWDILEEPETLAVAVAASSAVTAAVETTFDTSGLSIAANTLRAGDVIEVEAQAIITAATGAETTDIHLELGTTTIVATGALDVTNNDIAHIFARITIRTIGASGTMVASGIASIGTGGASAAIGALTAKPFFLASTAIDTTAAVTVNVTCTNSSTGESVRLDNFIVRRLRA